MRSSKSVKDRFCPNRKCKLYGTSNAGNIGPSGSYSTKKGRRQRYACRACGKTFCGTNGTPYYRLRKSRNAFDEVCRLSVEGLNIAAISRAKRLSWNTVADWLKKAAHAAGQFNGYMLRGFELIEPQADEIRTFVGKKGKVVWVIALIETWSRLWVSNVVGRRSYKNIARLLRDALSRGKARQRLLITTDCFKVYEWVIRRIFGCACLYGQVIKKYCKGRATKVERRLVIGTLKQLEDALFESEDSAKLNTSFIERLNLTIREATAYLHRRTSCHAKQRERLAAHLELRRCHYNFMRPHGALKFGGEIRTPEMQAEIVSKRLTFRQVFEAVGRLGFCFVIICFAEWEARTSRCAA
jgi:transposase-like protein/IS1 family transposase